MLNLLSSTEREEIFEYCLNRYGLQKKLWDNFCLKRSSEAVWAIPEDLHTFLEDSAFKDYETAGLRIFSGKKFPYKITDSFLALFGDSLSRGVLEVNGNELKELLFEKQVVLKREAGTEDGYIIISYAKLLVGVGLKRGSKIDSQIPKKIVNQLSNKLEFCD